MKLIKYAGNPILSPAKNYWEERCVLNPAVVYDEKNEKFVMLYRAAGNDKEHIIRCGLAESDDGINFKRVSKEPVFYSSGNDADGGCVEDPRLTKIGDMYYVTYAARAFSPGRYWLPDAPFPPIYIKEDDVYSKDLPKYASENITATFLAATRDFRHYKRLGRITEADVDDRDVVIFPEKINGKYAIISRPKFKDAGVKMPSIWISFTDDLLTYETPELLMTGETEWETQRIGAGTPPIKTDKGWFMLYHGVDDEGTYRVGAVLMDLADPRKIVARTKDFIMEPEFDYETKGIYNGCVFPTGSVVKDGVLFVYYGCADKYVSLATADFEKLVNFLDERCRVQR